MSCDADKAKEGLKNELRRKWSDGKVGEWAPSLHLRHSSFSNPSFALPTSQGLHLRALLILQTFRHFTYVTDHSPTLPSLYLRHSSFSNPSVSSHTSQQILQPFLRFNYVTDSSFTSPGEPPMDISFHLGRAVSSSHNIFLKFSEKRRLDELFKWGDLVMLCNSCLSDPINLGSLTLCTRIEMHDKKLWDLSSW